MPCGAKAPLPIFGLMRGCIVSYFLPYGILINTIFQDEQDGVSLFAGGLCRRV